MIDRDVIWPVIIALAIGTFLIRFSFLGLIGARKMPEWLLRHLRYTPVAVIPGLVAPLVFWPAATGGVPDAARLAAALAAFAFGWWRRSVALAMIGGLAVLYLGLWLEGGFSAAGG